MLFTAVAQHRARLVILDVTGTPSIDDDGARALAQAGQGVGLLGAELLLVGRSAFAAADLVTRGISSWLRGPASHHAARMSGRLRLRVISDHA